MGDNKALRKRCYERFSKAYVVGRAVSAPCGWASGSVALDGFDVVGGQHARLAGSLHRPVHPTLVDGLDVDNRVTVFEGNLISVRRRVVVHGPVRLLLVLRKEGVKKPREQKRMCRHLTNPVLD